MRGSISSMITRLLVSATPRSPCAYQPVPVAQVRGHIEPELTAEDHQRLRGGALPQNSRGNVSRKNLGAHKNQHRDGKKGQYAQKQSVNNELCHGELQVMKSHGGTRCTKSAVAVRAYQSLRQKKGVGVNPTPWHLVQCDAGCHTTGGRTALGEPALFSDAVITHVVTTGGCQTLQLGGVCIQVVLHSVVDHTGVLRHQFLAT